MDLDAKTYSNKDEHFSFMGRAAGKSDNFIYRGVLATVTATDLLTFLNKEYNYITPSFIESSSIMSGIGHDVLMH